MTKFGNSEFADKPTNYYNLDMIISVGYRVKSQKCNDNKAEHEATFSCKTYEMKDGSKKQEWHYGFRAHIICDAKYGLPIKSKVTPANNSEQTELDNLLKEMQKNDKEQYKLEKIKNLMGDARYDNGSRNKRIKEEYNVNPVIDIVHRWDKELMLNLTFIVMLTIAKRHIKNKQENIRSLVA